METKNVSINCISFPKHVYSLRIWRLLTKSLVHVYAKQRPKYFWMFHQQVRKPRESLKWQKKLSNMEYVFGCISIKLKNIIKNTCDNPRLNQWFKKWIPIRHHCCMVFLRGHISYYSFKIKYVKICEKKCLDYQIQTSVIVMNWNR